MTDAQQAADNPRKNYPGLHLLRCIACFMVIMIHIACGEFYAFGEGWWAANLYDGFSRPAVPLFFMMTGFLLLDEREMPLWAFYRKRFMAILPYFFLVSIAHHVYSTGSFSLEFFAGIVKHDTISHLWYVYFLIGIYLALPYFKKIYQHSTSTEIGFFLFAWFALQCGGATLQMATDSDYRLDFSFNMQFFMGYMGYVVLGACLKHVALPARMGMWSKAALCVIATAVTMICTYVVSVKAGKGDELFYQYFSPTVVFQAVALFMLLKDITCSNRLIVSISKCSYLMYLIHMLVFLEILTTRLGSMPLSPWFRTPFLSLCVFVLSYAISLAILETVKRGSSLLQRGLAAR